MREIDHIYVCKTFLVSNDQNIFNVKKTQSKKLCNSIYYLTTQVIFLKQRMFLSYRLNNHENSFVIKWLNFAISPKDVKYPDYLLPFE